MDDEAIGILAWVFIGLGGLIVALLATGGIMYAADTTVGADVVQTDCAGPLGGSSSITVETKFPVPGVEHTLTDVDTTTCNLLASLRSDGEDPFAEYSIRSGHTVLYDAEDGECLWDSEATPETNC